MALPSPYGRISNIAKTWLMVVWIASCDVSSRLVRPSQIVFVDVSG